jgi:hypothetical protein
MSDPFFSGVVIGAAVGAVAIFGCVVLLERAQQPGQRTHGGSEWRADALPRDGVTWIEIETNWGIKPYCCVVRWNPHLPTRTGRGGWQQADGGYFEDAPYRWRPARAPSTLREHF